MPMGTGQFPAQTVSTPMHYWSKRLTASARLVLIFDKALSCTTLRVVGITTRSDVQLSLPNVF